MSAELPPLETRISRHTGEFLGMPFLCPRRCCVRAKRCHAAIVDSGASGPLPECLAPLSDDDREVFVVHQRIAVQAAALIRRGDKPPAAGSAMEAYYLQVAFLTALAALCDDPAERSLARRWRHAVRFDPRLGPPPFRLQLLYRDFGAAIRGTGPADTPATDSASS